jgi:alpha-1,6-mannosyltransferase
MHFREETSRPAVLIRQAGKRFSKGGDEYSGVKLKELLIFFFSQVEQTRKQQMKVVQQDLILLFIILAYVLICPYSKVEESFNTQALFDLHHFNFLRELAFFDHLQFPGVVPRTFIGPLFLYFIGYPLYSVFSYAFYSYHTYVYDEENGLITYEGIFAQTFYRMLLGTLSWIAIVHFKNSLKFAFPANYQRIQELFIICLSSQFHINFYASRTLPNIFAFIIVMHGFALWLSVKRIL